MISAEKREPLELDEGGKLKFQARVNVLALDDSDGQRFEEFFDTPAQLAKKARSIYRSANKVLEYVKQFNGLENINEATCCSIEVFGIRYRWNSKGKLFADV